MLKIRKKRQWRNRGLLRGFSALALAGCTFASTNQVGAVERPELATFLATANEVFTGKGDSFASYVTLHDDYRVMKRADRKQAGQVLSMVDAMFGRYADASHHYGDSFPENDAPACPSAPFRETPAAEGLAQLVGSSRVLLLNESHSKVQTRAAIIAMLPVLKGEGFTHLALEALNPDGAQSLIIPVHGHGERRLRDDIGAGFYLREPVYAKLVENAQLLGFELLAYESESTDHEAREAQQAANLERWLHDHPTERLLVVAGYSHIWKNGDWMAQKLVGSSGQTVVSVDQIDGVAGCVGSTAKAGPSIWTSPGHGAWAAHPDRVDATMTWKIASKRDDASNWLSLGGTRKRVAVPSACDGRRPCLVEARVTQAPDTVPEDRLVAFDTSERPVLYLTPGQYAVVERTPSGAMNKHLAVLEDGKTIWKADAYLKKEAP